jgi:three-Cys-motif partner protein
MAGLVLAIHGLFLICMHDAIVTAFQNRLKTVAGFSFVPEPLAMRNSNNAVVYYLFFASQKPVAQKIIQDIFGKYKA